MRTPSSSTGTRSAAQAHDRAKRRTTNQQTTELNLESRDAERGIGRVPRQDVVGARGLLSARAIVSHSGNENWLRAWQSKTFFGQFSDASAIRDRKSR